MKKILVFLFSLFSLIVIISCEEVTSPDLGVKGKQWIQFENSEISGNEGDGAILVPIQIAANENQTDVTISFSVLESTTTEGYTISPSDGTVVISAGEFVGYIEVTPIDNAGTNDNIEIIFSIDNNSADLPLGLAGEGLRLKQTTVVILDDDCPLDLTEFYGTYSAVEDNSYFYDVVISEGPAAGTLLLSNLFGTGGTSVIELDNSDPSNPFAIFRSYEFNAPLYVHSSYGNVWASTGSDTPTSWFRVCDNFMNLYFKRCVSVGCFTGNTNVELTKN